MSNIQSSPAPLVVAVRLGDLETRVREALESARTPTGWDEKRLAEAVRHEFGFLGAFTDVRVQSEPPASADRSGAQSSEAGEWIVLRFTPPPGRDLARSERTYHKASQRAQRGDMDSAVRDFARVVEQFPEVAKYQRALGQAHLELGHLDQAEDGILRALRLDPRDTEALTLLGNLYMQRGRPADAIPLYERSLALERTVYALSNLGAALAKVGRTPAGVERFREATALDPTYPNAWYGLALALSSLRDEALLPQAIHALDLCLETIRERPREPNVWDAAQSLLDGLTRLASEKQAEAAARAVRRTIVEIEERRSLPVKVEEAPLKGILAKIEFAWVHSRTYHRLLVGGQPGPSREHYVLHELEHLALTTLARSAGRNRWFATSSSTQDHAVRAVASDIQGLIRRGVPERDAKAFAQSSIEGLLSQLFNFPIDLLIETRLLKRLPECRELIYESIRQQLETSAAIAENARLESYTPSKIFRANAAMNGAFALWFEDHFPRRTDLVARFQRTEAWTVAKRLYATWATDAVTWEPGAEYAWVDSWGQMLGLTNWFQWVEDRELDSPRSGEVEQGRHGAASVAANGDVEAAPRVATSAVEGANPLDAARIAAATFFMLGALEWIEREGQARASEVALEVARLGESGIDYLDPESRYTLASFGNQTISGLQALCLMYACFRAVRPALDPGIDLSAPYQAARQLYDARHRGGDARGEL